MQPAFAFVLVYSGAAHVYKSVNILDESIVSFANLTYYVPLNYYSPY